ncbi:hypothetical protein KJ695_03690, partial [Patescibacteria group bacterium]|nr:hypothetical protein [Patescibacteria group bacterium]
MSFFSFKKSVILVGLVGLMFVFSLKETKAFSWEKVLEIPGSTRVNCFGVYDNRLYIAANDKIYSYDGTNLTQSTNITFSEHCSFAVYNSKLYFGGNVSSIFSFDGTNWSNVYNTQQTWVAPLIVFNGNLYAGTGNNGKVFKYDGSNWTEIGTGLDEEIDSLGLFNNELYAGTGENGFIKKYDGVNWNLSFDSSSGWIFSLVEHNSVLYAGEYGAVNNAKIYRYDGTSWSTAYTDTLNDSFLSLVVYNSNLYAVGNDTQIRYYDGSSWNTEVNLGSLGACWTGSAAIFNGKIYIGGSEDCASQEGVIYSSISPPPTCNSTDCSSTTTNAPCKCGTLTAVAADNGKYCCAGNNAVYNTKTQCQVSSCAPPPLPVCGYGGLVPCGRNCDDPSTNDIDESKPCDLCAAFYMLKKIINFATELAVGIAVFILVIAGLLYAFSAGNPGN